MDLTNEISKSFNTIIQIIRNDLLTLRIKFRSYPGAIFGSLGQIGSCQGTTKVYATFIEKTWAS